MSLQKPRSHDSSSEIEFPNSVKRKDAFQFAIKLGP